MADAPVDVRPILVIAHSAGASYDVLQDAADRAGHALIPVRPVLGDPLPPPEQFAAIVVLGGPMAAYERHPFLDEEMGYVRAADTADVPILGICLGSHILAEALGGRATPGDRGLECGIVTVRSEEFPELSGDFFAFHSDSMEPPPDAQVLARTPQYLQAWRRGATLAVQFHPELSAAGFDRLLANESDKIARHGADPDVLRTAAADYPRGTPASIRLLDCWFADKRRQPSMESHTRA